MSKKAIIIGILVLILLAGGLFWLISKKESKIEPVSNQNESLQQGSVNNQGSQQGIDTSDWKTYINNDYKFSFKYPNSWKVDSITPSDMGGKWFSVAPEKNSNNDGLKFEFAVFNFGKPFKSENTPDSWYKNNIENPDIISGYKGETRNLEINGNPAYYVEEIKDSFNNGISYTNKIYVISHNDIVIHIRFEERIIYYKDTEGKNIKKDLNYSNYLSNFNSFVNSIEFAN